MHHEFLSSLQDLYLWDGLSLAECEEIARFIAAFLPHSFHFMGVETYEIGTQRHRVVLFDWSEPSQASPSSFALIPGGTVTLGYDRTQRFSPPSEDLIREWQECYPEYNGGPVTIEGEQVKNMLPTNYEALYTYLDDHLLPLRTITLQPFLIENVAHEAYQMLPPLMPHIYNQAAREKQGYITHLISRHSRGRIPHYQVVAFLEQQGFRLPSSDEWEYACSAGSRTLFHWGNGPFTAGEQAAEVPFKHNAFGLEIANDTYRWEYCSDPSIMRGGDGGVTLCGWAGELASSLPLASAYYYRLGEMEISNGVYSPYVRRALDLIPLLT